MTRLSSTHAAKRGSRESLVAIFHLIAIVVLVASSAQAQSRFSATPLVPGKQFSTTAQQKQEALAKGAQHPEAVRAEAVNPPHTAAACSPAISIAPGMSPAGYLPLSSFGVPPVAGVDDDTVTNFNVPAFTYAGTTYTSVGFSSNGYAVVGGGNSTEDNQFVNQLLPNPTRPNNVLAGFWTDLLPSAGGAMRIAVVTDGMDTWVVMDWEAVRYFSTTDTVTFEIWIGINGDAHPGEDITYSYGPVSGAGNNNALTVGAENALGDRGADYYFSFFGGGSTGTLPTNGTQLRVTSSTPASCQTATAEFAYGLTTSNQLISFNTNAPNAILSSVPITGLLGGEIALTIDFRPANAQLYALTNYNRLVTINQFSGVATFVGSPNSLIGNEYGFDFNPTVDRIRAVNDTNQNARINPDTGATAGTDTNLAFAAGDPFFGNDPTVTGAAYTNNFAGATTTTLYDIDSQFDILVRQGSENGTPTSPNSGQLFTIGSLGVDTNNLVGFDVSGTTGTAYATLADGFNVSSLYTINLANGNATLVGRIGSSATSLRGFSISTLPPPTMVGLTNTNSLVTFSAANPGVILSNTPITGLINGEAVIGIDYRPANNQLYGYTGYNRLVTIDPATGVATVVGSLTASLAGNEYGVDFNPTNDRLRIVNDTDQNASVDPTNAVTTLQTPLNPGNPNIVGIAYNNNIPTAVTTTLYDIDSNTDSLYIQNPPASGTLTLVGPLGVDTGALVGFDISGGNGVAYASLSSSLTNAPSLYAVNLSTGTASLIGAIGNGSVILRDVTVSPVAPPKVYAVTSTNKLVSFSVNNPGAVSLPKQITGLINGETVIGIDFRPANSVLYGYTSYNRLVTIDTNTAAATVIGSPAGLGGNTYGFDFNPAADHLRIVNDTDQNVRVNPDGTLAGTDTTLAYAAGDPNAGQNPNVAGAAYNNNFVGASSTTLFDIDTNLDILVRQGSVGGTPTSPNSGQLFTIGSLGVNVSNNVGFDISPGVNTAYAAMQPALGGSSGFYSINLTTGAATLIGTIGSPDVITGIAIAP